jgi:hypothetical protein
MVLRSWIERTPEIEEFEHISDPIRIRSYFLDLVDHSSKLQIVKAWISENKKVLDALRAECDGQKDAFDMPAFAVKSLFWQAQARQDWLKKIQDHLKNGQAKRLELE